jgi:predicted deacylase
MLPEIRKPKKKLGQHVFIAQSSFWVRAPGSGSLRLRTKMGRMVKKGEVLGLITDPYGGSKVEVLATRTGIVIGMTMLPLVNTGDGVFHIAIFEDSEAVEERIETFAGENTLVF